MKVQLIECKSRTTAKRKCPWQRRTRQVANGFLCYESIEDYKRALKERPVMFEIAQDETMIRPMTIFMLIEDEAHCLRELGKTVSLTFIEERLSIISKLPLTKHVSLSMLRDSVIDAYADLVVE